MQSYEFIGGPYDGATIPIASPKEFLYLPSDPGEGNAVYLSLHPTHRRVRYKKSTIGGRYVADSPGMTKGPNEGNNPRAT